MRKNKNCVSLTIEGTILRKSMEIEYVSDVKIGITKPQRVLVDRKFAYYKNSADTDNSDGMELLVNWIGRRLNIQMADTFLCCKKLDSERFAFEKDGLISIDVAGKDGTQFYDMFALRDKIIKQIESGVLPYEAWMNRYKELCGSKAYPNVIESFEHLAKTKDDVSLIVSLGFRFARMLSESYRLNLQAFEEEYLSMLFLDSLVGQVDRTLGNYGMIYTESANTLRFAPLFDDATLKKPYTGNIECMVNGFMCNRKMLIMELVKYRQINRMFSKLESQWIDMNLALKCLAKRFLEPEQETLFFSRLEKGIALYDQNIVR